MSRRGQLDARVPPRLAGLWVFSKLGGGTNRRSIHVWESGCRGWLVQPCLEHEFIRRDPIPWAFNRKR
jgi:hypothetical protein